jgi:hypothetical protein
MDYKKTELQIIKATKEFAASNNIHYNLLTESMVLNAMREFNKCFVDHLIRNPLTTEELIISEIKRKVEKDLDDFYLRSLFGDKTGNTLKGIIGSGK